MAHLLPLQAKMARKKSKVKAAGVLLSFALLIGVGSVVWAGADPGMQLMLVLDLSNPPGDDPAAGLWSPGAGLLVHLLRGQDYLGLVAPGKPPGVILPPARLTPEHRRQVLDTFANLEPSRRRPPFPEVIQSALAMFQPQGLGLRVLFILTDGSWEADHQRKNQQEAEVRQIAAQARAAGVQVFSVSLSATGSREELQTLASVTGGRCWPVKTVSDLPAAILNFYQYLVQPHEAPLTGTVFRLDPWVRQAAVIAARSGPGNKVLLTTPAGARITPRTRLRTIRWITGQVYDLIIISQPQPGGWSLAGVRPGDSRVFLDTELTLSIAGTPREVRQDEALYVTAALAGNKNDLAAANLSDDMEFCAELKIADEPPLLARLTVPEPDSGATVPPDARVGWFSPLHREGEATLRVMALGKTVQRLLSLPIALTKPWYRVARPQAEAQRSSPMRFQPDPGQHPGQMQGTVTLQSPRGALTGVLIKPSPGSEIIVDRPSGCQDVCLADLHLTGVDPGGRPLVIASGPQRLEVHRQVPDKPPKLETTAALTQEALKAKPPSHFQKLTRYRFSLVLIGMGIVIVLASSFLFWRERRIGGDPEGLGEAGDSSGKKVLRLQAQVEALTKEKVQLQAALEEKTRQTQQLIAEKADLQADLERLRAKSQGNSKYLEELEKKLEEAEREAQGVQQEYMALYARNQQEKEKFKKG